MDPDKLQAIPRKPDWLKIRIPKAQAHKHVNGLVISVDPDEPKKVAESVKELKLNHCVITSVDRDDLHDGGAAIWVKTIEEIKRMNLSQTLKMDCNILQQLKGIRKL